MIVESDPTVPEPLTEAELRRLEDQPCHCGQADCLAVLLSRAVRELRYLRAQRGTT